MLNIVNYTKTHNKREKYAEIKLSYWEAEDFTEEHSYMFWLDSPQTFQVKGDKVVIPIGDYSDDNGEYRIDFKYAADLAWIRASDFPVRGKDKMSEMLYNYKWWSLYHIWGEDDNIAITTEEFNSAGGEISLVYNIESEQYEVIITPPSTKIGVNENFSLSLEGSVPGLVVGGLGYRYTKKSVSIYTEYRGKTDSVLEVELQHVTTLNSALSALQRLAEKYNAGQPDYSVEFISDRLDPYMEADPLRIDNNLIIPQSLSLSLAGSAVLKNTSNGLPHVSFEMLGYLSNLSSRKFSELELGDVTMADLQYNLLAYLH